MKRLLMFTLAGLVVLSLVGLAFAYYYEVECERGDWKNLPMSQATGGFENIITSGVDDGDNDVRHDASANDGNDDLFYRTAYLEEDEVDTYSPSWSITVPVGGANYHVSVNNRGTGISLFELTHPL